MDKFEARMIEVVNLNRNIKKIERQCDAFAARLNAISARRKRGKRHG